LSEGEDCMALDDYWFDRADVEKFMDVLEKMGFNCEIVDLETKPAMRIWKAYPEEHNQGRAESVRERP